MPTNGGARATQKLLSENAGALSDAAAAVKSGADLEYLRLKQKSGLSDAAQTKLSGADAEHYDANN